MNSVWLLDGRLAANAEPAEEPVAIDTTTLPGAESLTKPESRPAPKRSVAVIRTAPLPGNGIVRVAAFALAAVGYVNVTVCAASVGFTILNKENHSPRFT